MALPIEICAQRVGVRFRSGDARRQGLPARALHLDRHDGQVRGDRRRRATSRRVHGRLSDQSSGRRSVLTAAGPAELLARAIVARDAPCPALTVKGTSWPMQTRADGSDPDFPIRYCETAVPGDSEAVIGGVKLKPRPSVSRRIVVIGDTGCRVTDYTAQQCDSAVDWPFFRIAKSASATNPDLVIHVGDYHYREKPCAGRTGCTDSPSGDNWQTWDATSSSPQLRCSRPPHG